ncbi:peptidase S8/S53 domain-containing protein [Podospora aff. communis PSN243]|uniref:Peptidase S8/S53 domain-containing protein n=1 Tax=Podospora aff. communis PSN243 TaxID=3040156 RepID=A0AAV9GUK3_9PEZI|nr:peptidase S8/S53 domain-containing protein [Podospora aff. communis PSN243]
MHLLSILLALLTSLTTQANPLPPSFPSPAPLLIPRSSIPGKYIIKLKESTPDLSLTSLLTTHPQNLTPTHTFHTPGFKGFAAPLDDSALATLLASPEVDFIESDSTVSINGVAVQHRAPWNLARLSTRGGQSGDEYRYDESAGAGTCVYVVDTGVDGTHEEFEGRVVFGVNTAGDGSTTDGNGHGTAVAGVVAGMVRGVAKRARVVVVKVLNANGSGTTSGVIAGLSYVANDSKTREGCVNGTVANISLGGGRSGAINAAAAALVNAGVFVSVAAGGSNDDVQYYSPASETSVFTVGATDVGDWRSQSSNYGEGVDVFAPGVDITVPWIGGGVATLSGTSMAAAHVSGLAAYFLGLKPNMSPVELGEYIQSIATRDVIAGLPADTKNLLAYNGIDLRVVSLLICGGDSGVRGKGRPIRSRFLVRVRQ